MQIINSKCLNCLNSIKKSDVLHFIWHYNDVVEKDVIFWPTRYKISRPISCFSCN